MAADAGELRELRRHKVSMVFQHFGLLAHTRSSTTWPSASRSRAWTRTSGSLGPERCFSSWPRGCRQPVSGPAVGRHAQRVGLARAFAVDPKLMLYDEPFSALDPLIRRDMQDEVIRLQKETGKTMLFITHDLAGATRWRPHRDHARRRDRPARTPEELVGSPADDYVANFVRDIPRTNVLTLRWIMRDARPERTRTVPSST